MQTAYFSLGANLGDRAETIRRAADALVRALHGEQAALSPLYETAPMYNEDQPRFVNAALSLHTPLGAQACLEAGQRVEEAFGRVRKERNGPRTLDVDLLGLGDVRVVSPHLTLPHPRMFERAFVLTPLADIAADWTPPGATGDVRALCDIVGTAGVTPLNHAVSA